MLSVVPGFCSLGLVLAQLAPETNASSTGRCAPGRLADWRQWVFPYGSFCSGAIWWCSVWITQYHWCPGTKQEVYSWVWPPALKALPFHISGPGHPKRCSRNSSSRQAASSKVETRAPFPRPLTQRQLLLGERAGGPVLNRPRPLTNPAFFFHSLFPFPVVLHLIT